jgi:integrase
MVPARPFFERQPRLRPVERLDLGFFVDRQHQAVRRRRAESTSATLGEACRRWLDLARAEGREQSTIAQYRQHVVHIEAVLSPATKLARLTGPRCEEVRNALLSGHSRAMARKVLASFKSIVRYAKKTGLIAHDPAADARIGGSGRAKAKLREGQHFPRPAQVNQLFAVADAKERALVALAALAGLRASEIRGLAWSDVDLRAEPATVTVRQRADRFGEIGWPKSADAHRTIRLGEMAALALREWRLAQPPGRVLVFGTVGNNPDTLGNLQTRVLTPLCKRADVPRYSWHALRHYAISSWLKTCGGNFKEVQVRAGHATLALTLDTYGHLLSDKHEGDRIAAAERLMLG